MSATALAVVPATLQQGSRVERIRRLYLGGLRPAEIAARLGITISNANTILSELRGRAVLPAVGSPEDAAIKARQQIAPVARGMGAGQGRGAEATAPRPARPRAPAKSNSELVAVAIASGAVRITKCPPAYLAPVQGAEPLGPLPHCAAVPDPFRNPPRRRCACGQYFVVWQVSHRHCDRCRAGAAAAHG
jgi:hypothetical protein